MPNARGEATEFEIELAKVQALLSLDDAELATMRREALDMARASPVTPVAAVQKAIRDRLKD